MSALKPVAWMHDGFISTDYASVQRDEERNWRSGFDSKPIIALYSEDDVAELRAKIDLLRAERDQHLHGFRTAESINALKEARDES